MEFELFAVRPATNDVWALCQSQIRIANRNSVEYKIRCNTIEVLSTRLRAAEYLRTQPLQTIRQPNR